VCYNTLAFFKKMLSHRPLFLFLLSLYRYSGASKMLEKKQAQISAAQKGPEKSSFMPKFFSSKKTRQSVGSRDFEAMYEDGKTKVSSGLQQQTR